MRTQWEILQTLKCLSCLSLGNQKSLPKRDIAKGCSHSHVEGKPIRNHTNNKGSQGALGRPRKNRRVEARSSPTPFAGGVGRDSCSGVCPLQVGAGRPYPSVRGPSGLPKRSPVAPGCRSRRRLSSSVV